MNPESTLGVAASGAQFAVIAGAVITKALANYIEGVKNTSKPASDLRQELKAVAIAAETLKTRSKFIPTMF